MMFNLLGQKCASCGEKINQHEMYELDGLCSSCFHGLLSTGSEETQTLITDLSKSVVTIDEAIDLLMSFPDETIADALLNYWAPRVLSSHYCDSFNDEPSIIECVKRKVISQRDLCEECNVPDDDIIDIANFLDSTFNIMENVVAIDPIKKFIVDNCQTKCPFHSSLGGEDSCEVQDIEQMVRMWCKEWFNKHGDNLFDTFLEESNDSTKYNYDVSIRDLHGIVSSINSTREKKVQSEGTHHVIIYTPPKTPLTFYSSGNYNDIAT